MDRSCYGPRKIREILIRHRFPPSYVEAALSRNVDYDKRARKRLDQMPRAKEISQTEPGRKKLVDALVRYGFDFSSARGAVEDLSGEEIISE
jgi:SOS response regulatory protein OraA/RecX